MPDSTVLRWISNNSQRDVYFDKHMVRRTDWSGGRTADIFRGICQNQIQKRSSSIGLDPGQEIDRLSQSQRVTEVFCWSAMTGDRGTHTQPTGMMTIEVTAYEEESSDERIEVGPCFWIVRCKWSHHCLVDSTVHI